MQLFWIIRPANSGKRDIFTQSAGSGSPWKCFVEESSNWCFPELSASLMCLHGPDWLIELLRQLPLVKAGFLFLVQQLSVKNDSNAFFFIDLLQLILRISSLVHLFFQV